MVGALKGPWYLPVERFRMGMAHGTGAGQLVGSTYLPSHGCPDFRCRLTEHIPHPLLPFFPPPSPLPPPSSSFASSLPHPSYPLPPSQFQNSMRPSLPLFLPPSVALPNYLPTYLSHTPVTCFRRSAPTRPLLACCPDDHRTPVTCPQLPLLSLAIFTSAVHPFACQILVRSPLFFNLYSALAASQCGRVRVDGVAGTLRRAPARRSPACCATLHSCGATEEQARARVRLGARGTHA